jgi:transcriptional regulator with XRE-family HTH domain
MSAAKVSAAELSAAKNALTASLRQARKTQRLSQLELSLRLGVSQRHVSFVESGRAKPSRELLLAWLQELEAPLVLRNEVLIQAGYAPMYSAMPLNDPALEKVNQALEQLLMAHDPMPALVIDAQWNLLRLNRGGQWLANTLLPGAADQATATPMNLLDSLIHPEGLLKSVVNLSEVGPALLARLRQEAVAQPVIASKVEAFADLLRDRLGTQAVQFSPPANNPVLTTRYVTPHGELAFFAMFTTFGTPQDITLASLRVEHLFAADATTRAVLRSQVLTG